MLVPMAGQHIPSGCSKSSNSSFTDFSNGRSRSQSSSSTYKGVAKEIKYDEHARVTDTQAQRTFEMTTLSAKLFDSCFAISSGLVSQLVPFFTDPSGRVISISPLGCAASQKGAS